MGKFYISQPINQKYNLSVQTH